ncbi:MAG TPA: SRPBCC family protein [Bacteroidia bacterium]|nr:SRPBCC family protein [Bacteroidia bacterium]
MELFLGGVVVAILVFILVMYLMGKRMPVSHTSTLSHKFFAPVDKVWKMITDLPTYSNWRGIKVEQMGPKKWKETVQGKPVIMEETERVENSRYVTRISNENRHLQYGGQWVFEFVPEKDGSTVVTITENGEVYQPIMRFISKYFYGHNTTKRIYLVKLEKALQEGK